MFGLYLRLNLLYKEPVFFFNNVGNLFPNTNAYIRSLVFGKLVWISWVIFWDIPSKWSTVSRLNSSYQFYVNYLTLLCINNLFYKPFLEELSLHFTMVFLFPKPFLVLLFFSIFLSQYLNLSICATLKSKPSQIKTTNYLILHATYFSGLTRNTL